MLTSSAADRSRHARSKSSARDRMRPPNPTISSGKHCRCSPQPGQRAIARDWWCSQPEFGKTWLSAFDSNRPEFQRILFVAHREEILAQSLDTFRKIRPEARLGNYTGKERQPEADVLFASIQTLGRANHLRVFDRNEFDYIVVDEFHHAAATTCRRLIDYFEPKFLLGLTATPERTDGGDLLALCGENLVYRCDLAEGIRRAYLSPFHYFGVPDEVDYENIPWRSGRFKIDELTRAVATQARAENAFEQHRTRAGTRTLAFCCSTEHADFMSRFFQDAGLRAVAVHSRETSSPRTKSLEDLEAGKLDVVFSVDMFNEGVDVPHIDTVMMLRPTESRILWLQQLGRGLRLAKGKTHLNVIDYIGNHRTFLLQAQVLFDLGSGDAEIAQALRSLEEGKPELPPGCEVTYDLEAVDILKVFSGPPRPMPSRPTTRTSGRDGAFAPRRARPSTKAISLDRSARLTDPGFVSYPRKAILMSCKGLR